MDLPEYANLIQGSRHILHSEFIRNFISAVNMLEYLGNKNAFKIEGVSAIYTPTTENECWRPWHHVYSTGKAGKNQTHKPQINQLGKLLKFGTFLCLHRIIY